MVEVDGGTEPGKCFCRREAKAPTVGLGIFKHEPDINVALCRDAYLIGKLRYPIGGKGDEDETGLGRAYEVDEHLTCQPDGDLGVAGPVQTISVDEVARDCSTASATVDRARDTAKPFKPGVAAQQSRMLRAIERKPAVGTTAVAAARAAGVGASYAARTLASSRACELGSSRAAVRRARL